MKKCVFSRLLLRWLTSVGSFWICILLFPYSFYCLDYPRPVPFMNPGQIFVLLGLTAAAGTVTWLCFLLLQLIGKWIGMHKNLILLFLYHLLIGTVIPYLLVRLTGWIDIEPYEMYLLIGFIPALLYSIIYSYEKSLGAQKEHV